MLGWWGAFLTAGITERLSIPITDGGKGTSTGLSFTLLLQVLSSTVAIVNFKLMTFLEFPKEVDSTSLSSQDHLCLSVLPPPLLSLRAFHEIVPICTGVCNSARFLSITVVYNTTSTKGTLTRSTYLHLTSSFDTGRPCKYRFSGKGIHSMFQKPGNRSRRSLCIRVGKCYRLQWSPAWCSCIPHSGHCQPGFDTTV